MMGKKTVATFNKDEINVKATVSNARSAARSFGLLDCGGQGFSIIDGKSAKKTKKRFFRKEAAYVSR